MRPLARLALVLAGVLGASGIAAAAASSHAGAERLGPYALVALTHAPAILALALAPPRLSDIPLCVLLFGATCFCLDLAIRHILGTAPIPLLAPIGGVGMMIGWLSISIAAFFPRR